jgi:DNA topoisomerase VI subunit A
MALVTAVTSPADGGFAAADAARVLKKIEAFMLDWLESLASGKLPEFQMQSRTAGNAALADDGDDEGSITLGDRSSKMKCKPILDKMTPAVAQRALQANKRYAG